MTNIPCGVDSRVIYFIYSLILMEVASHQNMNIVIARHLDMAVATTYNIQFHHPPWPQAQYCDWKDVFKSNGQLVN
jgi:hypothetical protein